MNKIVKMIKDIEDYVREEERFIAKDGGLNSIGLEVIMLCASMRKALKEKEKDINEHNLFDL